MQYEILHNNIDRLGAALVVNVMVHVLIIIAICIHLHFLTCMIAKDTRVRNMKYVQYTGHIQYLHDSARRVKGRRLVHNATDHYHRLMHTSSSTGLMSVTAGLVLFDILPLG